jgi:hypothetical protein
MSDFCDIVWFFSKDSAVPSDQFAGIRRRILSQSIPDFEKASDGPRLVVLDDLLNEA